MRLFSALDESESVGIEYRHELLPLARSSVAGLSTQARNLIKDRIVFKPPGMIVPPLRRFLVELPQLLDFFHQRIQCSPDIVQRGGLGMCLSYGHDIEDYIILGVPNEDAFGV